MDCQAVQTLTLGKFQQVTGLAVQGFTDGLEGAEPDGPYLACFQFGKVGQGDIHGFGEFVERHFAFCHHDVKVYNNCHGLYGFFQFVLIFHSFFKNDGDDIDYGCHQDECLAIGPKLVQSVHCKTIMFQLFGGPLCNEAQ